LFNCTAIETRDKEFSFIELLRHFSCGFTTVDPLAEKRPWMSPYAYCSDNPMSRIDPDGKDDYYINNMGKIVRRVENKKQDSFQRVDDKGKLVKGQSLIFKPGTVTYSQKVVNITEKVNGKTVTKSQTIDMLGVKGDANANKIYTFVAGSKQSDGSTKQTVEWSKFQLTTSGDPHNNILGTGNDHGHEYATPIIIPMINAEGSKIRDYTHSHPNTYGNAEPYPSDADYYWFREVHKNNPNATEHIYTPDDNQTQQY